MQGALGDRDRVPASRQSVAVYDRSAERMAELYESTSFEVVHAGVLDLLPPPGSGVLDVGAGSGRDAAALARRGYAVIAVEPSRGLREQAMRRHGTASVEWIDDALPDLRALGDCRFALILVSAVWMHVALCDRGSAMRRLSDLLGVGGQLVISLRHGPPDPSRGIIDIDPCSVETAAERCGLRLVRRLGAPDALGRPQVAWSTLVFEKLPA